MEIENEGIIMNNIYDHYDQYNLLIPCYFAFSLNDNPQKCRINLHIDKESFEIRVFKYDTLQNIDINYNRWRFARIHKNIVSFIGEDSSIDLLLFFINDAVNFKRFLFTLAEAGSIIPQITSEDNENEFIFIQNPSFIPTSCYSYSTKLNVLSQIKNVTQSQMMYIVENDTIPFNLKYIDLLMPFEIKETNRQINENNKYEKKNYKCDDIIDILLKKIYLDTDVVENVRQLMIQCQKTPVTHDPELERNINDVNKDSERMMSDRESRNWSKNLCNICSIICKMHVLNSGIKFVQGQLEVAKKIALLMNGESYIPGDNSGISESHQKLFNYNDQGGINDNFDFVKYLFLFYELIFDSFEKKDQSKSIEVYVYRISKNVLNMFKNLLPMVAPYFIAHQMNTFLFYNQYYSTVFCKSIKNIWPIWIMLKRMHNQEKAYTCLSSAILFLALPIFLEKKVENEDQLKEIDPSLFDLDNKVDELIKISFYLYICKGLASE